MGKKVYIETYGCQMNVVDSEIIAGILLKNGYYTTTNLREADVVVVNTCAIRERAEERVLGRLRFFSTIKKKKQNLQICVAGCMAEHLRHKLLEREKCVDVICGPDAYMHLPELLSTAEEHGKAINVLLSLEETYADVSPVRIHENGISAFISIMRGCNNMCTFCVVPFTRGRERSRDPATIIREIEEVIQMGYKEVTLLGQNVDSYRFGDITFSKLLEMIAKSFPDLRIRFSTSHPKDMKIDVLEVIAKYDNICKYIHLPVQSGSNKVLERMRRGYTKEDYLKIIKNIREIVGEECGISTDIIAGFCGETEDDHRETLNLMEEVKFHYAYTFQYSERPGTYAAKKLKDDVPPEVKQRRLNEIIELQRKHSLMWHEKYLNREVKVLVERPAKKTKGHLMGRTSENMVVVFPGTMSDGTPIKPGDYIIARVLKNTSATLVGEPLRFSCPP